MKDMAKALKTAGLKWVPQAGDLYYFKDLGPFIYKGHELGRDARTWLPRLEQLLNKIEQKGWYWDLGTMSYHQDRTRGYLIDIALKAVAIGTEAGNWYAFTAETAKGATGEALLWILKREEEEANEVDDR